MDTGKEVLFALPLVKIIFSLGDIGCQCGDDHRHIDVIANFPVGFSTPSSNPPACLEGVQVVATETSVSEIGIFASATSNFYIVILDRMKKKKYNLFVGNIGHFDTEINLARLGAWKA